MMRIDLTDEQRGALIELLRAEIGDLGMEIADTDRMAFRDQLKRKRQHLQSSLTQLNSPPAESTADS